MHVIPQRKVFKDITIRVCEKPGAFPALSDEAIEGLDATIDNDDQVSGGISVILSRIEAILKEAERDNQFIVTLDI